MSDDKPAPEPIGGCLLRLLWALAGPPLAGAIVLVTAANRAPLPSAGDYLFLAALVAVIVARLLDGRHGTDERGSVNVSATSPGQYAVVVVLAGAMLFAAVRAVAPRVL
jgi:hypothetical protein